MRPGPAFAKIIFMLTRLITWPWWGLALIIGPLSALFTAGVLKLVDPDRSSLDLVVSGVLFGIMGLALADPMTAIIKAAMERRSENVEESRDDA